MNTPVHTEHTTPVEWREPFGDYTLAVQRRSTAAHPHSSQVLALHGARANLHRWQPLLQRLQARGISSLAPSLSGHGPDSPIALAETSLAQNLHEALRFAQVAGPPLRMVIGTSMGGALALRVAQACADRIDTLVLCGPALYPEAAWSAAHFGEPFRQAISVPFGFLQSQSLDFLRQFRGRVVLIQGEWDGLQATDYGAPAGRSAGEVQITQTDGTPRTVWSPIPAEVFAALREAAGSKLQHIGLRGCDHRLGAHLQQHPAVADTLAHLLHQCLQTPAHATCSVRSALTIETDGQCTAAAMPVAAAHLP